MRRKCFAAGRRGTATGKIAREACVDRKTAARYTAVAASLFERGHELTEEEIHEVAQRVQARPITPTGLEWDEVAKHRERIEQWLAGSADARPLRLTKIHTLLVPDHGLRASYDTLWRHAHEELAWREKPSTVRVDGARR